MARCSAAADTFVPRAGPAAPPPAAALQLLLPAAVLRVARVRTADKHHGCRAHLAARANIPTLPQHNEPPRPAMLSRERAGGGAG
ncbi:hypothetical protein FA09DRAFT_329331 [Tilletiopsis washingtonensis]|uniref:Uncharacterized protein n=1 Tax=Tilletiopsis washingtonensis TaxID=58919 RepID=A0A316ZEU4_9BASI|nr:hypothetical protein FA09DRAFT_329331 [Tilletiopsis washingtonensis]PWN98845.1 hypothetical protein FA09DRAFT_329331 [Tilletiopsis washingtonensis]